MIAMSHADAEQDAQTPADGENRSPFLARCEQFEA
jgi:hypothetical protein